MNDLFFDLLCTSIGTQDKMSIVPTEKQWAELYELAQRHSLVGVCFQGLQSLGADFYEGYADIGMPRPMYLDWLGRAASIQEQYDSYKCCIKDLACFYEHENIGMMLLKGYGLSLFYPHPEMRKPGDIDVYLFNLNNNPECSLAWRRADIAVKTKLKLDVHNDSEHHTKFTFKGFSVENHYDFVNTRIRKSSFNLEKVFKELALDHTNCIEIDGQNIYVPNDNLNALFILRHTSGHFASEGISLRNILDWAFFITHANSLNWNWLWDMAKEYNMNHFLGCINKICVENLKFDSGLFPQADNNGALKEEVLNEIMKGPDIVYNASVFDRISRWWRHRWKHRICYSDSMFSSFIYSVRANLMKTSIE